MIPRRTEKKQVLKIEELQPGDLVTATWAHAGGEFDVTNELIISLQPNLSKILYLETLCSQDDQEDTNRLSYQSYVYYPHEVVLHGEMERVKVIREGKIIEDVSWEDLE